MSDQPPSPASATPVGDISFDKAEYDSKEAPVCLSCKRSIVGRYYRLNGKPFCDSCQTVVLAQFARKLPASKKVAGFFLVLAAVVGCAAAWYGIREATGYEIGLIAIGVAYVIAKALRRASGGLGSRGLQLAAVVLTYLSIAGANVPIIVKAMLQTRDEHAAAATAKPNAAASADKPPAKPAAAGSGVAEPAVEQPPAAAAEKKPTLNPALGLSLFALVVLGLALAAPFLALPENILGVLIIGIALYQAWRLTAPVPLNWEGPLTYEPPADGPVPALGAAPESAGGG